MAHHLTSIPRYSDNPRLRGITWIPPPGPDGKSPPMRILNERLLREMAKPGPCERCGKWCKKREAHHVFCRGSGRLDISLNLVSLGSTRMFQCTCHRDADTIGKEAFLAIVAQREGLRVEVIVATIQALRRLPKPANWPGERGPRRKKVKSKKQLAWEEKAKVVRRAKAKAEYQRVKAWRRKNKAKGESHGA